MLGDEFRRTRLTAGLSQEELGFRAKISRNYVSLLELNQKSPTVEVLVRIAKALGVRASVIVARTERRTHR